MRHTRIEKTLALLFLVVLASHTVAGLGIGTFEKTFAYTPDQTSSISYYIIKQASEKPTVRLDVEGDLAEYATFNTNNYWYSTKVDDLDVTLSREFDLRNTSSANLTFQTKYNIEYGWDFGYIEISTDNRSSWSRLSGTGTTAFRDGGAYVGYPGSPAYTGVVSDWTLETVDLTPYAGNLTVFRFHYLTDSYYSEHGWLIDDITIAEIGFFDDVESVNHTWIADGWVDDVLYLDDNSTAIEIELQITIPSNYTSNDTENRIIIGEIPGVDAGFNPTYSSVPEIIARIPSLVKVILPTQPSSGGGGGPAYSQHFTYRKGVVHYIVDRFFPNRPKTLDINKEDSLIRSIEVIVNQVVDDAIIQITPLDEKPAMIKQDLKGVFRFFEVSTSRLFDSDIDEATLLVAVPKKWVEKENKTAEDIVISRFSKGSWTDLPTVLVDEDRQNYYFEFTTPGFSVFAVRIRQPIEPPKVIKPVPTIKPNISDMQPVMVIENRSVEDVREDLKVDLIGKTGASEEEVEETIDRVIDIRAEETPEAAWARKAVGIAVGILILLLGAAIFASKKRTRKRNNGE